MRLESAENALDRYTDDEAGAYSAEDLDTRASDLISDLLIIVREREGERGLNLVRGRIDSNLGEEPNDAEDYQQLAQLAERDGLTSYAAKLYERADALSG
jgi:hypothetical protein